jgi:hypothetical protein
MVIDPLIMFLVEVPMVSSVPNGLVRCGVFVTIAWSVVEPVIVVKAEPFSV